MSIGFIIIGLLLVAFGMFIIFDAGDDTDVVLGIMVSVIGIFIILLPFLIKSETVKPIEYPASKYTLELKVTEYQGEKDTTYVLIPKTLE